MSRKYPSQNASENTRINREKQRYSHTVSYHTAHVQRELAEKAQAKIDAYRQSDPEGFARRQQARNERSAESDSSSKSGQQKSSRRPNTAAGAGLILGGAAEAIASVTFTEVVVCVAIAYGAYRLYKWWRTE